MISLSSFIFGLEPNTILWIIIPIFLLWIGRDFICWFFRINQRVDLMKKNNELLEEIFENMKSSDKKSEADNPNQI